MNRLLVTAERDVEISHHQFVVQDFDWDERADPPLNADGSLGVGETAVRVISLVHTHAAVVVVEVWDGVPDAWTVPFVDEVCIVSKSGVLLVDQLFDGFSGGPIALGMPGRYRVWIGRTLTYPAEQLEAVVRGGMIDGMEQYLIRLWREGDLPDGMEFADR